MTTLRVLVADDEALARNRAVRLLGEVGGVEVVALCTNGVEVLSQVAALKPDMLLLDIQMPGLDGFAAATLLGAHRAAIVFCTAHSDHAVPAFELGAVDYVLKPLSRDRLKKSIQKARAHLLHNAPTATASPPPQLGPIALAMHDGVHLIAPESISHVVLEGELTRVFAAGRSFLSELSLAALEAKLPPGLLERVHRKALLNLAEVHRLESCASGGYDAHMKSGHVVEVSRQAARELRVRLGLRSG